MQHAIPSTAANYLHMHSRNVHEYQKIHYGLLFSISDLHLHPIYWISVFNTALKKALHSCLIEEICDVRKLTGMLIILSVLVLRFC